MQISVTEHHVTVAPALRKQKRFRTAEQPINLYTLFDRILSDSAQSPANLNTEAACAS